MNGPSSAPQPLHEKEEGSMAKKKLVPESAPKWSQEEKDTAENILAHISTSIDTQHVPDKYAQASKAAVALGLITNRQTFRNLPSNIKSYLEFVWRMESPEERLKRNLVQMDKDYAVQMKKSSDFFASRYDDADELAQALHEKDAEKVD